MTPGWQVEALIELVRLRYEAWADFDHPLFVTDEIEYKQKAVAQASEWLNQAELDRLIAAEAFETMLERLDKLAKATNLLFLRLPSQGDTATLHTASLDKATFCIQFRNLLYADRSSPDRLQTFSDYLTAHDLPNKWPFPTYFLFLCHPDSEMYVKPRTASWFLKFMGQPLPVSGAPDTPTYAAIRKHVHTIKNDLLPYGVHDMVDVQSMIWVGYSEAKDRIGRLDPRGQIELGVPENTYELTSRHAVVAESDEEYEMENFERPLAEPFASIFTDRAEAEWAFDFLREAAQRLGMENPQDERFTFSIPRRRSLGGHPLHMVMGNWLVIGFRGLNRPRQRVRLLLLKDQVNLGEQVVVEYNFSQSSQDPDIVGYGLPIGKVKSLKNEIKEAFESSLDYIRDRFKKYGPSPWRRNHIPEIAEALFDAQKRDFLLSHGLHPNIIVEDEEEESAEDSFDEEISNPPYYLKNCAEETGYTEADLARWVRAIERKGQAVFYGPPGTGKTYIAERLARHLIGGGDGFTELVQFHPAYAYEDFMQGIRPLTTDDATLSYDMVHGRFYTFCQQARQRTSTCVLIIDEINRANVAGVFGELMYLLEYRDKEIALSGGGRFSIPGNVRLLATMNTADRSIALVDHALRRRFAFIHVPPNYDLLRHYHQNSGYDPTPLIRVLDRLNKQIGDPHYQLGTSFFMRPDIASQLEDIWRMEVEPYLEEYFFDQTSQIEAFRWQKIKKEIGG